MASTKAVSSPSILRRCEGFMLRAMEHQKSLELWMLAVHLLIDFYKNLMAFDERWRLDHS